MWSVFCLRVTYTVNPALTLISFATLQCRVQYHGSHRDDTNETRELAPGINNHNRFKGASPLLEPNMAFMIFNNAQGTIQQH